MKLRINEKDTSMKYKTYGNIEKCFDILVNEKGYSKEEAQDIIDHILADYKYNPNSINSLSRQINLVLSKDEYEKEFGITERYIRLREKETPNIEVKHEGILEVPEGKKVDELPYSHFEKLAKKKGLSKITRALNNLQVWNKNDDKDLSKWAGDMIDKLNKKLKKDEGVIHRAYNLDNDESRRKEIADTFGHNFTPDNHILICRDNKPLNIQVGKKYKCTACNDQRVEVVSIDDVYTDDRGDTASITVLYRGKMYAVASTQLYESYNAKDVKVSINEDLYNIIYDVDSEDGYTYTEEEMFKGSWTDLQNLIKQMKSNGCYNIDANAIYDEEDFEESLKESVYTDMGFSNRKEYLNSLADDYGVDIQTVYDLASVLGPDEDFDALVTELEDLMYNGEDTFKSFDQELHYDLLHYNYVVCDKDVDIFDFIIVHFDTYEDAIHCVFNNLGWFVSDCVLYDTRKHLKITYVADKLDISKLDTGKNTVYDLDDFKSNPLRFIDKYTVGEDTSIENARKILDMCEVSTEKY